MGEGVSAEESRKIVDINWAFKELRELVPEKEDTFLYSDIEFGWNKCRKEMLKRLGSEKSK